MIRVKIQFCYSAVRFRNETALLSYYAICSTCYDSQVRYSEIEIRHFIITNCNTSIVTCVPLCNSVVLLRCSVVVMLFSCAVTLSVNWGRFANDSFASVLG